MSRRDLDLISEPEAGNCGPEAAPPLDETEAAALARVFAALSDPARLRLFALIAAQPCEVCACSLVDPIGRSQPTVSHHLKVLYEAGLVDKQRKGSWIWYRVAPGVLDGVAGTLSGLGRDGLS